MGDEPIPPESVRVRGVAIVKPIILGNISQSFGKKRESDGHTHDWTVYVKPYDNEDMSSYVKKVQFKLHESYANPNRFVDRKPLQRKFERFLFGHALLVLRMNKILKSLLKLFKSSCICDWIIIKVFAKGPENWNRIAKIFFRNKLIQNCPYNLSIPFEKNILTEETSKD